MQTVRSRERWVRQCSEAVLVVGVVQDGWARGAAALKAPVHGRTYTPTVRQHGCAAYGGNLAQCSGAGPQKLKPLLW